MTDQTVSGEVSKIERTYDLISAQTQEFAKILPEHIGADRFTRWALTVLRRPELQKVMQTPAGQMSVMSALMDCASLGLEPGRTYHLLPFGGQVTGVTDYKGEIQLITNADPDASVIAMLVRQEDDFRMTGANIPPKHDADWFDLDARGPIVGGYSYVSYPQERYSQVVRMGEADFLHHKRMAKIHEVWNEWPEPMRVKTLIHQLRKYVPWSAERQRGYR